jgi:hypothetical protein
MSSNSSYCSSSSNHHDHVFNDNITRTLPRTNLILNARVAWPTNEYISQKINVLHMVFVTYENITRIIITRMHMTRFWNNRHLYQLIVNRLEHPPPPKKNTKCLWEEQTRGSKYDSQRRLSLHMRY